MCIRDSQDADVSGDAVSLRATPAISWTGTDGCPTERPSGDAGRSPRLSFAQDSDSDVAFGISEGTINEIFLSAWRDGYFCFTEENISEFMTLLPGDVISTGTPGGVGLSFDPPIYLQPGDVVELGIDGLGTSRQSVAAPA